METLVKRQQSALKLVERIIELDPDQTTLSYALKMQERLKLPMSVVLDKLNEIWPDTNISEKVKRLGVTQGAYYAWTMGWYRPGAKMAKKLAKLTGFEAADIQGRLPRRR